VSLIFLTAIEKDLQKTREVIEGHPLIKKTWDEILAEMENRRRCDLGTFTDVVAQQIADEIDATGSLICLHDVESEEIPQIHNFRVVHPNQALIRIDYAAMRQRVIAALRGGDVQLNYITVEKLSIRQLLTAIILENQEILEVVTWKGALDYLLGERMITGIMDFQADKFVQIMMTAQVKSLVSERITFQQERLTEVCVFLTETIQALVNEEFRVADAWIDEQGKQHPFAFGLPVAIPKF
jgi:hypothetical protein